MLTRRTSLRTLAIAATIALLGACSRVIAPEQVGPIGDNAVWFHVRFANDSAVVGEDGQKKITEVIAYLRANPGSVATLIGRTDTVGSKDYNAHLSHLRADAVRDALVYAAAIPADRVEVRWAGASRPVVATGDQVSASANRVVDIAIH